MDDCTCENEEYDCSPSCECFHHDDVPEEDDYYSYDGGITWFFHGRQIFKCSGECEEPHNVEAHLAAYARMDEYWPNAWIISDHGNAHHVEYMR